MNVAVIDDKQSNSKTNVNKENVWQKVKPKNKSKKEKIEEVLLEDVGPEDDDIKDIHEEIVLLGSKNSGHRRSKETPQETPVLNSELNPTYKCDQCKSVLESQGLLNAHISTQHTLEANHSCQVCNEEFQVKEDLEKHMKEHKKVLESDEWNCNDCAFQVDSALELMKHLQVTGHQPRQGIKDKRKVFKDFKECYTCKMAFDGFFNLLNHRKKIHPSNKKCRNFSSGNCPFIFMRMQWIQIL